MTFLRIGRRSEMSQVFKIGDEVEINALQVIGLVINTSYQRTGSPKLTVELDDGTVTTVKTTECSKVN